jgi:hypothetical protein
VYKSTGKINMPVLDHARWLRLCHNWPLEL